MTLESLTGLLCRPVLFYGLGRYLSILVPAVASLFLHLPGQAMAADHTNAAKDLAFSETWLKLLHYERSVWSPTGWVSAIQQGNFFLSAHGSSDPAAELEALVQSLSVEAPTGDDHPRCRFPARSRWVEQQLGLESVFEPASVCPRFSSWAKQGQIASVSLVYATGYLGNPASYYGHTLLKFNGLEEQAGETNLLDATLNFGAIVDGNDDPVSYIIKGVTGGYAAAFSHVEFYFHNHNYGENELRDLWEYRLNLPQTAVTLLVEHSWEVLGQKYTYYFFRRNCAYRMGELLELVEGIDVIPKRIPWTIPQALIQAMGQVVVQGGPLIAAVRYYPSRQSRFYARYGELSPDEQVVLSELVLNQYGLDDSRFTALHLEARQRLLDALLDYSRFVSLMEDSKNRQESMLYQDSLAERFRLPSGTDEIKSRQPISPHQGRPAGWAQLAWATHDQLGSMTLLRLRPAYYDPIDAGSGHVANAALSMADLQLVVDEGQVRLHKLYAIAIESVQPGISGLPSDRGRAWKIRVGIEQASGACIDCPIFRIQGDYGIGHQWVPSLFTAVYLGGAVQSESGEAGWGFGRLSSDAIFRVDDRLSARLALEYRYGFGGSRSSDWVNRSEVRWLLGERTDLRLSYERDDGEILGVGFGVYW